MAAGTSPHAMSSISGCEFAHGSAGEPAASLQRRDAAMPPIDPRRMKFAIFSS
jgi:hypothetical protein